MSKFERAVEVLRVGKDATMKVFGNSMMPLIESGSSVTIRNTKDYEVADVVVCKVKGRWMVHKITRIASDGRYMISNNKGHDNGWTRQIYGRVIAVNNEPFGRPINTT